jgi:cell division protein FtsB
VARALEFLRRSWLAVGLFTAAGILLLSAARGERGLARVLQLQREVEAINDRNFHLVQEINELREQQASVRDDPATVERLARRHLSMVRPGEVLYHVPPPAPGASSERDRGREPAGEEAVSR